MPPVLSGHDPKAPEPTPLPVTTRTTFAPRCWAAARKPRKARWASSWRSPCKSMTSSTDERPRASFLRSRRSKGARAGLRIWVGAGPGNAGCAGSGGAGKARSERRRVLPVEQRRRRRSAGEASDGTGHLMPQFELVARQAPVSPLVPGLTRIAHPSSPQAFGSNTIIRAWCRISPARWPAQSPDPKNTSARAAPRMADPVSWAIINRRNGDGARVCHGILGIDPERQAIGPDAGDRRQSTATR